MPTRKTISKKVVQDIVPNENRSIRNIRIEREVEAPAKPIKRKVAHHIEKQYEETEETIEEAQVEPIYPARHSRKNSGGGSIKYFFSFILILISLVVIGIALSLSYSKATVTITPKIVNFDVDGTFTAKKSAQPTSVNDDNSEIGYEVLTVSSKIDDTILATKGPSIQTKAKGTVVIYNNHSATSQTLVAGTRLSNPSGLIYRTATTVSIPGKKTTAGSVTVSIVADQAGENYNAALSDLKGDFKIVGYKGTDKYNDFYGRLKTDLAGGFSGNKMVINNESKTEKIKAIESTLKDQLIAKLNQSVPKDYILFNSAYTIEYVVPEPVMKDATTAQITVTGIAYGALFKSDSLVKFIAGKEIKKFPAETYSVKGDRDLDFKVSNTKDFSIKKGTPLIFTLRGPLSITGTFSESKLKDELVGVKMTEGSKIFAKYTAITNASTLLTPFWLRSFPNSADKIQIEYKH